MRRKGIGLQSVRVNEEGRICVHQRHLIKLPYGQQRKTQVAAILEHIQLPGDEVIPKVSFKTHASNFYRPVPVHRPHLSNTTVDLDITHHVFSLDVHWMET